jgi:hypothetical protein
MKINPEQTRSNKRVSINGTPGGPKTDTTIPKQANAGTVRRSMV